MKRNIEKIKDAILKKVRFHAPICFESSVDKSALFKGGVNINLPIFKYDQEIDRTMLKAVKLAEQEEPFNFVIPIEKIGKKLEKIASKVQNIVFFSGNNANSSFLSMINKLNINYKTTSNYDVKFQKKYFMLNDKIINPTYRDFSLIKEEWAEEISYTYREFILNGNNIYFKVKNNTSVQKSQTISLNLPLENGYYCFKRGENAVYIHNLRTLEKQVFSYICPHAKISFSAVDGLENSRFATINILLKFTLKPNEEKFFFFLLSNKKCPLKTSAQFDRLFNLSMDKCRSIFDVRVKTADVKFDQFFNFTLPRNIWIDWNRGIYNEGLVEKYLVLRRMFVRGKDRLDFVPFRQIGLKELGIYNGEVYKKVLISFGNDEYMQVGKTKFFNVNCISQSALKNKEPIFLAFKSE